jgi:hypothetical protein
MSSCFAPLWIITSSEGHGLRTPVPAIPHNVPQLQRHLPLHLQLPVEFRDELVRAAVDVVVPAWRRQPAAHRPRQDHRRGAAAGRRHAPRRRRPHAGGPAGRHGRGRRRRGKAVAGVKQAGAPLAEAERAAWRPAGDGGEQHPPRDAEGEQEPHLLDRRLERAEDPPLLGRLRGRRRGGHACRLTSIAGRLTWRRMKSENLEGAAGRERERPG